MRSREIQIFGFVTATLLILFIVIFLGKDFYRLYTERGESVTLPDLQDDQIVMDSHAVKVLQEVLDEESADMMGAAASGKESNAGDSSQKGVPSPERSEAVINEPEISGAGPMEGEVLQNIAEGSSEERGTLRKIDEEEALQTPVTHNAELPATAVTDGSDEVVQLNREIHRIVTAEPLFDKHERLTVSGKKILEEVTAKLTHLPFPYAIVVEGHTSSSIPEVSGKEMAEEAALFLRERLPEKKITTVSYGSTYPLSDDLSDNLNTRIEIVIRRIEQ